MPGEHAPAQTRFNPAPTGSARRSASGLALHGLEVREDVMSLRRYIKRVACLSPRATVVEASQEMRSKGVGTVVVISDDYQPLGLVTDRDIATRVVAERKSPDTPLEQVMSGDVISLPEDATIQQASEAMRDRGVRRVPITDENGRVTGLISFDDLLLLLGMEIGNLASAVFTELAHQPEHAATP
jgi:CBS domain-containing protein